MGGGKAAIDHYATPIRPNRIIFEIGGTIEYNEVRRNHFLCSVTIRWCEAMWSDVLNDIFYKIQVNELLKIVADRFPFKAIPVSQEILEKMAEDKKRLEASNLNTYTFKYAIKNNLNGIHKWLRPTDHKWFGEYL